MTTHEPVAVVYYVLRELADRAGLEILNVNSGTDEFEFFLAPSGAADRWRSVHLGDGGWVESPEWHFAYTFTNVGWELRYPAAPIGSPKESPAPPT